MSKRRQTRTSHRRVLTGRQRGIYQRRVATREVLQRFLIVCEGEETEPNYFKSFRVPGVVVNVTGIGKNTTRIVKETIGLRQKDEYDQVWCVFDRNSFPVAHFNSALQLAHDNGIRVAYSNPSFELWYRLHFSYIDVATSSEGYKKQLTELLGHKYTKNSDILYDELETLQPDAISNAMTLHAQYDPSRPADDNPSTTVHLLVQELRRFAR